MNLKKTLVLLIMLGALLTYLFFVEVPDLKQQELKDHAFATMTVKSIEQLEIKSGSQTVALRNSKKANSNDAKDASANPLAALSLDYLKGWELSRLPGAGLDNANLNTLLNSLLALKTDEPVPQASSDLSRYGLTEKALLVKVTVAGQSREILLGSLNPFLKKRYFKFSDKDQVYLTDDTLYGASNKSESDFRDHAPLKYLDAEVKSIVITKETAGKLEKIRVLLDSEGKWQLLEPIQGQANTLALAEFHRSLRNMRVKSFIDDLQQVSSLGLDKSNYKVQLEFNESSGKKPIEISFVKIPKEKSSKAESQFFQYISGAPSINELIGDPIQLLDKPADLYREKQLFNIPTQKVKRIVVEGEGRQKLEVVKEDADWLVNKKGGDKIFINQWISNLSQILAQSFPEKKNDYGFAKPRLKFTVDIMENSGTLTQRVLVIGEQVEGGYYAAVDDLRTVFVIKPDSYKLIAVLEEALVPQIGSQITTPAEEIQN